MATAVATWTPRMTQRFTEDQYGNWIRSALENDGVLVQTTQYQDALELATEVYPQPLYLVAEVLGVARGIAREWLQQTYQAYVRI